MLYKENNKNVDVRPILYFFVSVSHFRSLPHVMWTLH